MSIQYVYVAGPISHGDTLVNIRNGLKAGIELVKYGFHPFVPHMDFVSYILDPETLDYETILHQDLAWIRRCDALYRLQGFSPGAEREVEFANDIGLPVFYSLGELLRASGRDEARLGQVEIRSDPNISFGGTRQGLHHRSEEVRRPQLAEGNPVQQDLRSDDASRVGMVARLGPRPRGWPASSILRSLVRLHTNVVRTFQAGI